MLSRYNPKYATRKYGNRTVPILENWNPVTKISGPTSMYIFTLFGKKYYFFGDIHHSRRENDCGDQCDDFDPNYRYIDYTGSNCMTIGALLHNWFIFNNDHNIKTDFYIETYFTKQTRKLNPTRYHIESRLYAEPFNDDKNLDDKSWMEIFPNLVPECFLPNKQNCQYYPNVHIHYSDVRIMDLGYKVIYSDPFIIFDFKDIMENNMLTTIDEIYNMKDQITLILSFIINDYKKILQAYINPNGLTNVLKLFIREYSQGLNSSIGEAFINKFRNMGKMHVIRNGIKMHRTAAEILKLQSDPTYGYIANLIIDFTNNLAEETIEPLANTYLNIIDDLFNDFEQYQDIESGIDSLVNIIDYFADALVPLSVLSMDPYLLARMFFQKSDEIITFAGAAHIQNYITFFTQYLNQFPVISIDHVNNEGRCVESNLLPQYLNADQYRKYVLQKTFL